MKVGEKYGRLTVTRMIVGKVNGQCLLEASCECGAIKIYTRGNLARGNTKSCGCFRREFVMESKTTHGKTGSREYRIWTNMKERCNRPSCDSFKYYGARGISVCKRWMKFHNFYEDMGDCPTGMSIERMNSNDNYRPENCKWATSSEQAITKRNAKLIEHNGEILTVCQLARRLGIHHSTFIDALKHDTLDGILKRLVNGRIKRKPYKEYATYKSL